jgi:hypothetical protein
MKNKTIQVVMFLAFFFACGIALRMFLAKSHFEKTVEDSYMTTEGYDKKFIALVDRLENILATRASFGYPGGKDPMTGQTRQVISFKAPSRAVAGTGRREAVKEQGDPFKLTALIYNEKDKKFTAVIMDGERSFSVEDGDVIGGRKISSVTKDGLYMESNTQLFFYDIYGNRKSKPK